MRNESSPTRFPSFVAITILVLLSLAKEAFAFSAVPTNQGLEIRVCQDRDCITDGAKQADEIVTTLVQKGSSKIPVTVNKCGCLGPCGKGPNIDVRIDGVRVKDSRPGQSNYYVFREIDSAQAAAKMLEISGMDVPAEAVDQMEKAVQVESTRAFWDFDRTTRIAFQRLLYATVALPLIDADENGTWDVINGQVYENSCYAIAAAIFIGSQFMGTSSAANKVEENDN
jgi:(2Fe-2S) ferredoxin